VTCLPTGQIADFINAASMKWHFLFEKLFIQSGQGSNKFFG